MSDAYTKADLRSILRSCGIEIVSQTGTDMKLTQRNNFEAMRFISQNKLSSADLLQEELIDLLDEKPEFIEFPQLTLDSLYGYPKNNPDAPESVAFRNYLHSRKITDEAIDHFRIGWSGTQKMFTVPLHSPDGIPVGIIGRSIEGKAFKNSPNLPRNKTMFNIHKELLSLLNLVLMLFVYGRLAIQTLWRP